MDLIKPQKLNKGDTIATLSPSLGLAGDSDVLWRYELGKKCLEDLYGLHVVAAPNSMKGSDYLSNNPQARAEDMIWAFENKDIKAVIANIGGSDSIKIIPFIDTKIIKNNPKVFIGYSDVMNIHLLCYKLGLSTFYGHNLLPIIAETPSWHPYSQKWFEKVLFDNSSIGLIEPSGNFSCDENDYPNPNAVKTYHHNNGYLWIQGSRIAQGRLFGGHTGLCGLKGELHDTLLEITVDDFKRKILFIEDIAEFFSSEQLTDFLLWLGNIGALQQLKGVIIGKLCAYQGFDEHKKALLAVVNKQFGLTDLPIVANMNFGHTSPICILPYGALAEINCDNKTFSILESGVE